MKKIINHDPKVGVVISSYNRLKYLKQAVTSVINQSYKNIEIVITDDHSSDKRIKLYLETELPGNIRRVINKVNLGVTENYNQGVNLLSRDTDWCLILDNDDFLDKDCILEAVNALRKHPQTKVIHCRQIFITDDHSLYQDRDYPASEPAEKYISERAKNRREIRSSAIFFSRSQFKKIDGYPRFATGLATDAVFVFGLAYDNRLVYAKKACVYTRLHNKAESHDLNNIIEKFSSVSQMIPYSRKIVEFFPHQKNRNLKEVIKSLQYYEKRLFMVILTGKLRLLLSTETFGNAHRSFLKIVKDCRKSGFNISRRGLLISYIYAHLSCLFEKFGASTKFMFRLQRLGSGLVPFFLK